MISHLRETGELVIDRANRLLNGLLERPADAHDLTNGFHATAQETADTVELLQVPSRNLDDAVVQARLEACASDLRDRVLDLVERNAETKLGRDERKRVTRSLRRES